MSENRLGIDEVLKFITIFMGCGACGRFDLYCESAHSAHAQGWYKLSCPHCANVTRVPVRDALAVQSAAQEYEQKQKRAEDEKQRIEAEIRANAPDPAAGLRVAAVQSRIENETNALLSQTKASIQ